MKINKIAEILKITGAVFIIATAVFFFMEPSHAAICSISGLAIILEKFLPLTVSEIMLIFDALLLVVGFATCGGEFGVKTVYTSILLPLFVRMYEIIFPNFKSLTGDQLLDVVCYCVIAGFGMAMLFDMNASSGGLDIVAKMLNKYFHVDIGKALSIAGVIIAFGALLAYDVKTVVLSLIGTYLNGKLVDFFIFDKNLQRRVCIISPKENEILNFIIHDLKSGATVYEAFGGYHMSMHREIIAIVNKSEYQKLMNFIREVDPQAFITVYTVSKINYRSKELEERKFD